MGTFDFSNAAEFDLNFCLLLLDFLTVTLFLFSIFRAWDMSKFLNIQCRISRIRYPPFAKKWINIRKSYGNFYKVWIFAVSSFKSGG